MKTLLIIVSTVLFTLNTSALRFQSGDQVNIDQPVYEDLYVAGGTIIINAAIHGDLIVAGGTVTINDTVTNDILLAGGTIIFNGFVGDDIRCAGGSISISTNVNGDIVITGGKLILGKEAVVAGNLFASSGELSIDGTVMNDIKIATGKLRFNGKAGRNLEVHAGDIIFGGEVMGESILAARTITITPGAAFHDNVRYWNKVGALDMKDAMKKGQAVYDPSFEIESGRWEYLGFTSGLLLLWYLGVALLMIFLFQYLFASTVKKAAGTVLNKTLASLGIGVLFIVLTPVIIVVCFVTLVGVPIAIVLLFGYITILLLATVITAVVAVNWINQVYYQSRWTTMQLVLVAFVIFIVLKMASLTPFLGPVIMGLLACLAFGAILLSIKWKRQQPVLTT